MFRPPEPDLLGQYLIAGGVIDVFTLRDALAIHARTGQRLGEVLIDQGQVSEQALLSALASQTNCAVADSDLVWRIQVRVNDEVFPMAAQGGHLVVGCTDVDQVRAIQQQGLRPVWLTRPAFEIAREHVCQAEYSQEAASGLRRRAPDESADHVLNRRQTIAIVGALSALVFGMVLSLVPTLIGLMVVITVIYVLLSAYRLHLTFHALSHQLGIQVSAEEIAALGTTQLPIYTILVPLYHEAALLSTVVQAMDDLDYPRSKLDVRILLEEDDVETLAAVQSIRLPAHISVVTVPDGLPKGKPRACNYGLIQARGEYVVIYDAEDVPEPDQLKKAIIAFRKSDERLTCVQAKLNYFNREENVLTRWFASEYSMWFELFLPGLDATNAPIPLGGTSNHFRVDRLRALGAWDAYNVTEDADVGVRLYKAGGRTAIIESTTYEEATSELYNWLRQRSRWVKGYIQTYLVHMRHPIRLWCALGPQGFFSFQCMIGGTPFLLLFNPLLWGLTTLWFLSHLELIQMLFPGPVFYLGCTALYIGNATFVYMNVAGCLRRGYYDLVRYTLLSPIYWALMSVAAWKGFIQLFYRPSYWEKTEHGSRAALIALREEAP